MRELLLSSVDTAFSSLGDLVKTATLRSSASEGYNWETMQVEKTVTTKTVEVVPYQHTLNDGARQTRAILKYPGPFSMYTEIDIDGVTYKIEDAINHSDILVELTIRGSDE